MLQARQQLVAHSDPLQRIVRIEPPGFSRLLGNYLSDMGFGVRFPLHTYSRILDFRDTSADVARRLLREIEKLLNQLYGGMELPGRGFDLRLKDEETRLNEGL